MKCFRAEERTVGSNELHLNVSDRDSGEYTVFDLTDGRIRHAQCCALGDIDSSACGCCAVCFYGKLGTDRQIIVISRYNGMVELC